MQGFGYQQIANILLDETGTELSKSTIRNDVKAIRKEWSEQRLASTDALINKELARIDATEREAWRVWKASCAPIEQKTIEEIAKQVDGDLELVINKVKTVISDTGAGVGDPRFFNAILSLQQERRKLLGVYAPSRLGLDITKKSELTIKGYGAVSPDDWPDVVEGEIIREVVKELPSG